MHTRLPVFLLATVSIPIALNAEQSFFSDKLPSIVKNIAQGFEDGNAEEAAKNEAATYSLNAANSALDDVEDNIVATTPFTHLELSLGSDAFGLDTTASPIVIKESGDQPKFVFAPFAHRFYWLVF